MKKLGLAAALILTLISAPEAQAQSIIQQNDTHARQRLDFFGTLGFWGAYTHFGAGAWYAIPVAEQGFLPKVNDAFFVEFGGAIERFSYDYNYSFGQCDYSWFRATPMGGVRWSFYLHPEWSVFATGKAGFGIGFGDSIDCGGVRNTGFNDFSELVVDAGVGAHWQFSDTWGMRFDLGRFGGTVGAGLDL